MDNIEPGTIYIDDRIGSCDLADYLPSESYHIGRLTYGDAAFSGFGKDNKLVLVSVEIKTIGDLIGSIESGRFIDHQLRGILETYDICYLFIEGMWRINPDTDHIQIFKGTWFDYSFGSRVWLGSGLESWMISMENLVGLNIRRTNNRQDSARVLSCLSHWFSKEWDKHTALNALHKQNMPSRASLKRLLASMLPGIGWKRSSLIDNHFKSAYDMINADVDEWLKIDGIGKATAEKVCASLRGK